MGEPLTQVARDTWNQVMESHSGAKLLLGPTNVDRFVLDPKRMAFFFSRYKFAAKMLHSCRSIADVGCGDGSGTLTFASDTRANSIHGLDFDRSVIEFANEDLMPVVRQMRGSDANRMMFEMRDVMADPFYTHAFDGLACMDVIEHIEPEESDEFIARLANSLVDRGVAVIGTPNANAAQYGSEHSKIGHINLFTPPRFRRSLEDRFSRVFMFSMNDEVVHTGFDMMAHYLLAVCVK